MWKSPIPIQQNTTRCAFFHATNYQSAQEFSKHGINFAHAHSLDFGSYPSFYLNPSIENVIKNRKGFNGIVVYWVDTDRIKSMNYWDLVSEDDDLWKKVVVASRCTQQESEVVDTFNLLLRLPGQQSLWTAIVLALFIFIQNR
jgi:hypothetical protein